MLSIKKVAFIAMASVASMIPLQAYADDLIINNRTDFDSTSIINNGACSSRLGEVGISRAHTEHNVVPGYKVRLACILNSSNCKADVYLTADCTGPKIATVYFDVSKGIISATSLDSKYNITGTGFEITMTQN